MKLILKIEHRDGDKVVDSSSQIIEADTISVGRGAGAQIRLNSQVVAALHAVFKFSDEKFVIQDLGSSIGTQVNGNIIQQVTLKEGDIIRIGPSELKIYKEGDIWGVLLSSETIQEQVDEQEVIKRQLERLDIQQILPSLLSICLAVAFIVAVWYFLIPLNSEKKDKWSSGPMASAHKSLEHDCASCHSQPFKPVQDSDCMRCHKVEDHTSDWKKLVHDFTEANKRCAECHMEHNGVSGVHLRDSRECSVCHDKLQNFKKDTGFKNVKSLAEHPEFQIAINQHTDSKRRVSLGEKEATDSTTIYLNHAIHLKENLRGPNGKVTLACVDCHALTQDKRQIVAITFEKNCRSCHPLEFDPKFPNQEVPHGNQNEIRDFLFARYSQLLLEPEQKLESVELPRTKPGTIKSPAQYNRATLERVEKAVIEAETQIYKDTGCQLCHKMIQDKDTASNQQGLGSYKIIKPKIPNKWLPHAEFNHKPHLHVKCQDCHKGVMKSEKTSDLLLPNIASCRECHGDKGVSGKIESDCVECHRYH